MLKTECDCLSWKDGRLQQTLERFLFPWTSRIINPKFLLFSLLPMIHAAFILTASILAGWQKCCCSTGQLSGNWWKQANCAPWQWVFFLVGWVPATVLRVSHRLCAMSMPTCLSLDLDSNSATISFTVMPGWHCQSTWRMNFIHLWFRPYHQDRRDRYLQLHRCSSRLLGWHLPIKRNIAWRIPSVQR